MLKIITMNKHAVNRLISLLFLCWLIPVHCHAQQKAVTLHVKNVSIATVLNELKVRYGLSFVTRIEGLDLSSIVTVDLKDSELGDALKTIFFPQQIEVAVSQNIVRIAASKPIN